MASSSAGIRQILVTGLPGVGKTTMVRKVIQQLRQRVDDTSISKPLRICGFYTEEVRKNNVREGFDVVEIVPSGSEPRKAILARDSRRSQRKKEIGLPHVGKYAVFIQDFESLALPIIADTADCDLLVVDEIGKMESYSKAFCDALVKWLCSSLNQDIWTMDGPAVVGHDGGKTAAERGVLLATVPARSLTMSDVLKDRCDSLLVEITRQNRDEKCDFVLNKLLELLQSSAEAKAELQHSI